MRLRRHVPQNEPTVEAVARPWAKTTAEVLVELGVDDTGLTGPEATTRLADRGPNRLEETQTVRPAAIMLRQVRNPLIYILIIAGAVTVALDEYIDAAMIGIVIVINIVIGFFQEYRAERSLEALRRLARTRARVLRDGAETAIDAEQLVPGDIVLIETGAKIPADCRVLHATSLEVDESLLTGESVTVSKTAVAVNVDTQVADRGCMLHMGSIATRGHARGLVTATGHATELGRVAGAVGEIRVGDTPLQKHMGKFTRMIGLLALAVSVLGFALGLAHGEDPSELFRAMVALAVASIPESLPIVLTITLAISVSRMAKRGAIVRRLPAVETLGSCTIIGSDKTGTLTMNRMTVERIFAGGRHYEVTSGHEGYGDGRVLDEEGNAVAIEPGSPLAQTLLVGAIVNEASLVDEQATGDPTEISLLASAAKAGMYRDELEDRYPRLAAIPFASEHRYAATFNRHGDDVLTFIKGAPEQVLDMCSTDGENAPDRDAIYAEAEALAGQGLRVLAMAYRNYGPVDGGEDVVRERPTGLVFAGLQGMMDPPRDEARQAVADCRGAGIRPLMITGDHAATAIAIARQIGIAGNDDRPITGAELDLMDDDQLGELTDTVSVYARVSPEHKLRLVRALQERGHVVAVTGDGVNDAPALKQADIGAAMGRSGTDVAKEAADMVITDDNFATIFAAVGEGRVAFANVRKTTFFLISGNAAGVIAVLISLGAGFALPFVAVQLLWLNLATTGVQDIALAFEPGEKHLAKQRSRPRDEGVLSSILWERVVIAAIVMAAGTLFMFHRYADMVGIEAARSVALTTMVMFLTLHVGNSRSETISAFAKNPFSNRFLFVGTIAALALHIAALYLPFTQFALHLEPISLQAWAEIIVVTLSVIVTVELHKLFRRPRAT